MMQQPSVSILEHAEKNRILIIYRIIIRDGKGRERNWRIATFLVTDTNVKEMNMKDIWEFW
jgi:hypothetical protein